MRTMRYRLIVLGSGQDGGSPQVGRSSGVGPPRDASSVGIAGDDGTRLLFDASPDIRAQYSRFVAMSEGITSDEGDRTNPFDAVFLTHGHMGHYAGLVQFGKEAAATKRMPMYGLPSVAEFLERNEPWASLFTDGHVEYRPMSDAHFGPLTVEAIAVPHRAEHTATCAFSISVDRRPWVLYLPDIDHWDEWPAAHETVAAHPVSFLDATFSHVDELPGRDIQEIRHPLVPVTIERFADLTSGRRVILTHVNHSNELADPESEIARAAASAGFDVAVDGLVIDWTDD